MQPNDPRQVPLVGERLPLEDLMEMHKSNPALQTKLQFIEDAFPEYRPVIGDGNCFYRWCAHRLCRILQPRLAVKAALLQPADRSLPHRCRS